MTSVFRIQPPLAPAGGAWATFRAHLPWLALLFPAVLFLLLLFMVPVGQVLWLSLKDSGGQLTGGNYAKLVMAPVYLQSLWITFKLSFWTTVVCVVGGYPVAHLLATAAPSSRQKLLILVLIPFWTSYLVRSFSWMVLLGRQGVINSMLTGLGLTDQPLSMIYNYAGALIGMVNALMPLFILAAAPVMARIDRNYLSAAATMGAGHVAIVLANLLPALAAGRRRRRHSRVHYLAGVLHHAQPPRRPPGNGHHAHHHP